ncbi:toll/interleukin-1 receptor domain-containing protein [Erythrobacter sp. KY5]|uniref:toll/interleukin-1 receptor domain-containing protein n=1 Tax=Erythrobacter sp. KY5 TaxID=2011159 RepID=UPI0013A6F5B8|nr:toll/interleukin-1 receptor domain-containing protein [Erythrobacter sp. KY5]
MLDSGLEVAQVKAEPVWQERPDWLERNWTNASRWLSRPEDGFEIWREWYYGRLEGLPHAFARFDAAADDAFYRWIVEQDDEWWSREPAEVNADIKEFVDSLRTPKPDDKPRVDFFVSYASPDEAAAREVAAVLDQIGKSYIVQYRDFPQANFVNAMNDAMDRADRLIPLYSSSYVASDHCNAEWNYYYHRDPSSVERRIVGFKLDRGDLKPLMQTVNHRDLTRYPSAEREEAIREWIEWEPPTATRKSVADSVERLLSPQIAPSDDGKLDTRPNPLIDVPVRESALDKAVRELLLVLDIIFASQHNLPGSMQRALERYDEEVRTHGAKSAWGGLNRLVNIVTGGLSTMSSAEFADGQRETLEELVGAHNHCMSALPSLDLEKRALSQVPVQDADQEAVRDITQKLRAMHEPLREAGHTTKALDTLIDDVIEEGRDVAHAASAPDADTREQGSKRRYLMYVGGIGFAVINALGAMATIADSPAAVQAMLSARELVEAFFKALSL